jgi:tRNA U34 5-carboxymethylaminomethyl modifying GTPase MnmE/TrmE
MSEQGMSKYRDLSGAQAQGFGSRLPRTLVLALLAVEFRADPRGNPFRRLRLSTQDTSTQRSKTATMLSILRKSRLKDKEMRVLMLGLDNAGKTTIVKRIMGEDVDTVSPTLGFIIKTIEYQGCAALGIGSARVG